MSSVPAAARRVVIPDVIEYEDQIIIIKLRPLIFNKNRQNVSHDGKACRYGAISGSRSLSHDIATIEHTGFCFGLCPGAGDSQVAPGRMGFAGHSGYAPVSQFGLGYGGVQGVSPFGYGSFGAGGYVGSFNFVGFPAPRLCRGASGKGPSRPRRFSRPQTPSPWCRAGMARRIAFVADAKPRAQGECPGRTTAGRIVLPHPDR